MALELIKKYEDEFPKGTPLVCACETGRFEDVKRLMSPDGEHLGEKTLEEYVNQEGKDSRGFERTPLMVAAEKEDLEIVLFLIGNRADPNIVNIDGENALHFAARMNKNDTKVIELLLTNMTLDSINMKDKSGWTPLDETYHFTDSPIKQKIIALIRLKGGKANRYDASGRLVGEGNGDLNNLHFRF